jgi:hypothetical protein
MDLNEFMKNPEQLKNLIQALQAMLPADGSETTTDTEDGDEFTAPLRTKGSKRKPNKNKNKFLDMPEKDMHKDDIEVDKKLAKFAPVSRSRSFDMIDVVCRVCGKKETISPSLLFEAPSRYKCNNCSTQSG